MRPVPTETIALLLFLGACTGKAETASCEARVSRLQQRLTAAGSEPSGLYFDSTILRVPPLEDGGLEIAETAPLLSVLDGQVALDGRLHSSFDDAQRIELLLSDLELLERNYFILHPGEQRASLPLYVLAEPSAQAEPLLELLERVPARFTPGLLVRRPQHHPLDPFPPRASAKLRARLTPILQQQTRAGRDDLVRFLRDVVDAGTCQQVRAPFADAANADVYRKPRILTEGLSNALAACKCRGVDIDALEAATIAMLQSPWPPIRQVPIPRERLADLRGRATRVGDLVELLAPESDRPTR